jgi:putative nucleotidyltransferase with HDIG domain
LPAEELEAQRQKELWAQKENFETQLGLQLNQGAYALLINEKFSAAIADLIVRILYEILNNGVVANKEVLLRESEKGVTLRNVASQTEKTVYSLRQYYGPDQAKTMVRIVAEPLVKDLNYNVINLAVDMAQRMLQPNITLNRNETEERKKTALAAIKPIMYQIKAGEMLLREGEKVTPVQLLKIHTMQKQAENKKISTTGLGAGLIIAVVLFTIHLLYLRQPRHSKLDQTRHLLFIGLTLVLVFIIVKLAEVISMDMAHAPSFSIPQFSIIYAVPAASGAMLICIFLGFDIALPFSVVTAVSAALLCGRHLEVFLFFLINNSMAAFWIRQCRERKLFIKAGAKLGLLNILLVSALSIYTSSYSLEQFAWSWVLVFLGGIGSSIITLGFAPLVEMTFHYTTDITLLELANLDRPILRRLMLEAPGTYHHSVIVGSLAEASAAEIGANPLLAKVCGYYHDIGKVKKPLYFIENQTNGRNKHDKLAPSMSSLILIAHVKEGVDIARKNKIGRIIIDTIQQHHGTSLISYFYEKAKQLKGEDRVKQADYRYPGPKPQTKEAGLVMLADVVEAASRTLENPTPARIQGLVQLLINKIFSDGQLDNCELTLKDLNSIAKSFNTILYGIHHHRIEYAESTAREDSKGKNGSPDRQPANRTASRDQNRPAQSPGHLKRLGQS